MADRFCSPQALYEHTLANSELQPDPAQKRVVTELARLHEILTNLPAPSALGRLLGKQADTPRGLYLHGGVGRGKTLMMNLFHWTLPEGHSQRLHFHDFMLRAHEAIEAARKQGAADPVEAAANSLLAAGKVICFDEMEVRDIADAMILKRLFEMMWEKGLVMVATSNRHPNDLYKGGLHRDRFLPFVAALKQHCDVLEIGAGTDWRAAVLAGLDVWLTPDDAASDKKLAEIFTGLSRNHPPRPDQLVSAGRVIEIPKAARDIAFADFDQLCGTALAARDYLLLADRYAGLVLSHIPLMGDAEQNEARRFMWLVDALYDRGRFLVASAAAPQDGIYQGSQWKFEFERTRSRLVQMARLA